MRVAKFLVVPLVITVAWAPSQAMEPEVNSLPDQFLLADTHVRSEAAGQLSKLVRGIRSTLARNLEMLVKEPDRTYGSPFHLTLLAIQEWDVDEAVPTLVQVLDFQLDASTFPVGGRPLQSTYYPVAHALSKIGGKGATEAVLERAQNSADDSAQRASAWILRERLGQDLALVAVEARLGQTTVATLRDNLTRIAALLRDGGPILPVVRR